jgi:4-hydroxybenzoate polyprenyltransferase
MKKIRKFIQSCEEARIGFGLWITSALFIIFIRDSIESLVSTRALPLINPFHLLHVPVFFLTMLLSIIILLHFFTKENILKISKLSLIFFAIIIFPVFLDLIFLSVAKTAISYTYVHENVLKTVLNSLNPFFQIPGVPYSLRIEVLIICVLSFLYTFLKTNKVLRSFVSALLVYCLCVIFGSLPGLVAAIFVKAMTLLFRVFHPFFFGKLIQGTINENIVVIIELFFAVIVAAIWFKAYNAGKFKVVIGDFRFFRYFGCAILISLGLVLYLGAARVVDALIIVRILGLFAALFFALRFSAVINDIFDVDCDRASNRNRPLITGLISESEYLKVGLVYLAFALLFAIWVSQSCFIITLLFSGIYFLYSAPPYRLKRYFIAASLITGIQALLIVLMGQLSLALPDTTILLPLPLLLLVFLVFSLSSNIKDLKDVTGDRLCDIHTLPVLFGEEKARKIIAFLVFLSYLSASILLYAVFYATGIIWISFLFGFVSYLYIRRENSGERIVFLLFFLYLLMAVLFFVLA